MYKYIERTVKKENNCLDGDKCKLLKKSLIIVPVLPSLLVLKESFTSLRLCINNSFPLHQITCSRKGEKWSTLAFVLIFKIIL